MLGCLLGHILVITGTNTSTLEFTVKCVCMLVCKASFQHLGAVQVNRQEEEGAA